jgi:anaphase-promoting complex subunit 3
MAQTDNEDIRLLLAESYLGEGKAYKAYEVLKSNTSAVNRYKFALTCIKLNKLVEAERALLGSLQIRGLVSLDQSKQFQNVPNGAAGLYMLGSVREALSKRSDAIKAYEKALEKDPTLWCAFERLCVLKPHEVEPSKFFTEDHEVIQRMNL